MTIVVTTRSYDNARSGVNTQESVLTAATVATRGIRRLFSLTIPGGAATTAGMAFTTGIAVVVAPGKCSPSGSSFTRTPGSPSISMT